MVLENRVVLYLLFAWPAKVCSSNGQPILASWFREKPLSLLGFSCNLILFSYHCRINFNPHIYNCWRAKNYRTNCKSFINSWWFIRDFCNGSSNIWISFWCTWRKFLRRQIPISTICYVDLLFI